MIVSAREPKSRLSGLLARSIRSAALTAVAITMLAEAPLSAQPAETQRDRERAAKLHQEFDHESFRKNNESAAEPIDFDQIDYDLLSAAVFHETNRRRIDHDLEPLGYMTELIDAALIQAWAMEEEEMVGHVHPEKEKRTHADRLEQVDLRGAFSAENVAMTFGIRYESEKPFVTRREDGSTVFSYEPGGKPIAPHTYLSFAESLLDAWMDSEGHRRNILSKEPELLGTGHVHGRSQADMDIFYSVQVFYTDLDIPEGAEVIKVPPAP